MNQLDFLPTDEQEKKDPVISAIEEICKDSALKCTEILINMATGKQELDKERRLACCDVLGIAYGTKFRTSGRPKTRSDSNENASIYSKLLKTVQEDIGN